MGALLVGYARCSTDQQDLTAQRDGLLALGVEAERIYVDHGLTGTNRERPGLREALAACRAGDTLVVTKRDRVARSLPDARAIADELTARQISLSLGGSVYDPTDAVGRLLFNVLAMVAEFSNPTSSVSAPAKGRRSRRPRVGCGASSPSSAESRKPTWCHWCTAVSTARSRWPSSSAWAAPRSTAPSNANGSPRRPTSRRRQHRADPSRRRRPVSNTPPGRRRPQPPAGHANAGNGSMTDTTPAQPPERELRLRYAGDCHDCGTPLAAGWSNGRGWNAAPRTGRVVAVPRRE